nr:ABC transporter substrate-binding protein [uncultured Acidocella sp.]
MALKAWLQPGMLAGLLILGMALPQPAAAAPITVTDMAGRTVTLDGVPQRIALQDGRVGMDLALLNRAAPFQDVVVWNNLLKRAQPGLWALMVKKWPAAAAIPDMGFDDNGEVNVEQLIADKPQLLIAELRARPVLEQDGAMKALAEAGIKVLFVDDAEHPVPDAAKSVLLLGKVLGRAREAQAYYDFYQSHYQALRATIAKQPQPRPNVFVGALAGQHDANNCCFTHGNFGWGVLVQEVGARNLGSTVLHTPSGQIGMETLLAEQPDVIIMTGQGPSGAMAPMGFGSTATAIDARLAALEARPGFAQLKAVQAGRVYGIYHPFYSSVLNIVGLEYLAKFIYPAAFEDLDPGKTYADIMTRFTALPPGDAILGQQSAPHE